MAAAEVGQLKFADWPNISDAHAGCNIYSCLSIDQWHQLLMGLCKDHTWEWVFSFLKDIYSHENGLDLIDQ